MKPKTLADCNNEIKDLENKIEETEKYIETHPEKQGIKDNLKTLYYVYNELIERKNSF